MKIATYNVNGIKARLPVLLRWLDEKNPDVVCLQELKSSEETLPFRQLEENGYTGIYHGQKSWNGVAILSRKYKIEEITRGLPGNSEDFQSRYLEAIVNGIHICCIYLPNGNPAPGPKFDYKLRWFELLIKRAGELINSKQPTIITGDFNVIPTEQDAYKPERWINDALFFPESREAFKRLLNQGWTDAIREYYPKDNIYTFWDYYRNAFNRNAGIRIDHFLLSPHLEGKLQNAGVDRDVRGWTKTSDHAPVWIEIENDNSN